MNETIKSEKVGFWDLPNKKTEILSKMAKMYD